MNTQRIVPPFSDRTVSFHEEVTRPTELPIFASAATEPEPPRVWLRPAPNDETVVTRRAPVKTKSSLVVVCILSVIIGALAGYLGRAAFPFASHLVHGALGREPRHVELEKPASFASQAASTKAEIEPAPAPARKKKTVSAPKTPDLEMETSFRMDS